MVDISDMDNAEEADFMIRAIYGILHKKADRNSKPALQL